MINFEKKTWYNKNDTPNLDKRIPISATHLNRIEDVVSAVVEHENDMTSHWWRKSKITDIIVEKVSKIDQYIYFDVFGYTPAVAIDIYYSDSASVKTDSETGEQYVELDDPSVWNVSYNSLSVDKTADATTLKNKYIVLSSTYMNFPGGEYPFYTSVTSTKNGGVLYYCSGSASGSVQEVQVSSNGWQKRYRLNFSYLYTTQTRNIYGEEEYVSSPDRDAHPDGWNETELLMYEYLGIPFENSRESGGMITGWYYGDGTQNRLIKTAHKPKMVMSNGSIYAVDYGSGNSLLTDDGFFGMNAIATKYSYVVFY